MVRAKIDAKAIDSYDSSGFKDLKDLEAIRVRPGMYVYNTGIQGFNQLFTEIFDNSVDEAMNGYGDEIIVRLNADGGITVKDFGRGMPVDEYNNTGMSTLQKTFITPHMGGKFSNKNYNSSGGLHGVGSSVVLALSEYVDIKVYRDGYEYILGLKYVNPTKDHPEDYDVVQPFKKTRKIEKGLSGTEVTFKPSTKVFGNLKFRESLIEDKINYTCYLENYLKVYLIDDRKEDEATVLNEYGVVEAYDVSETYNEDTGEEEEVKELKSNIRLIKFEGGLKQLVADLNSGKVTKTPIIGLNGEVNKIKYEGMLQWNNDYGETLLSFTNNIRTTDGGYHETAIKTALTKSLQDFAKENGLNKMGKKTISLDGKDIREGLVGVISLKIPEVIALDEIGKKYVEASEEERENIDPIGHVAHISFEGQTKGKLSTGEVKTLIEPLMLENFRSYFNTNPKVAETLINKAITAMKAREAGKKARNKARNKKDTTVISDKLAKSIGKDFSINELFLVEGE